MQAGVSPYTVASNLRRLSSVWAKWFIEECEILGVNPWDELVPPKTDRLDPRYLTPAEEEAFATWLAERWGGWRLPVLFFMVKGLVGCRIGELAAMPW
jgi:hypothetical protein